MTYDTRPFRGPRDDRAPQSHSTPDPKLRELLSFLRDTCREVATRLDRYLGDDRPVRARDGYADRGYGNNTVSNSYNNNANARHSESPRAPRSHNGEGSGSNVRDGLERLREEARRVSDDAPDMEPAKLRLLIEAITAETRSAQGRAEDPDDQDLAAKILRTLTAVVSEHRPGHVYGLARHHTAEWTDVARRARDDLASGNFHRARADEGAPRSTHNDDDGDVG
jgi:hypothetical protein